jgi:hypothetical protein
MTLHTVSGILLVALSARVALADDAKSELRIAIDDVKGKPLPCRVHLYDAAGKPVLPPAFPSFKDHFVCDGRASLMVPLGKYRFEIERGPEHQRLRGNFEVGPNGAKFEGRIRRIADLKKLGWRSGDLHIHRPMADIELLMKAEDLDVGPVITWWNRKNLWSDMAIPPSRVKQFDGDRFTEVMGGEDERGGGALLYFNLDEPLPITGAEREFPSAQAFADSARRKKQGIWIDIEKPFWWDAPTWLASGKMDSIGLANNHMCRSQMSEKEAWGKSRDEKKFPPPRGNGMWTQEIYYHVLNCGLRVPPSAGSASGVLPNPVGYNRVYVQCGEGDLTWEKWWAGLRAGRCFVTNGPLLLVKANGKPPGAVFKSEDGKALTVQVDALLNSLDRVPALEIVRDGRVVQTIPADDPLLFKTATTLEFKQSGWFLVRAVTDNPATFRFASTGPYYVEIGKDAQRISRASAEFFKAWTEERMDRLRQALKNEEQLKEVLKPHTTALEYWKSLIGKANAE